MPQELNVLCCYSCKMFQVHIVKKARKWQCKVCNAKQSIQQIYFQGSGQQCRLHVQKLNAAKANFSLFSATSNQSDNSNSYDARTSSPEESGKNMLVENKWAKYLDSSEKERLSDTEDSICEDVNDTVDIMPKENSLCNENDNASCSNKFEDIVDDSSCESEDGETKESSKTYSSHNSNISNCNFEDNSRSNMDHNNVTNIFETYGELNENEDMVLSEKLCTNTMNDSCSNYFEDTGNSNCEKKDVTYKTENLSTVTSNDKCELQNESKSNKEYVDVANIFETYGDLGESLKF